MMWYRTFELRGKNPNIVLILDDIFTYSNSSNINLPVNLLWEEQLFLRQLLALYASYIMEETSSKSFCNANV